MAMLIENIITENERKTLCEYLATEDERSDVRPDVTSKHPRWDIDKWPQDIVERGMEKIFPKGYEISEILFWDTKIGLKPHTDNVSKTGTIGKTVLLLLDMEPTAHTLFFDNYSYEPTPYGQFFTRQKYSPYQYKLPNKEGKLIVVEDLRDLLIQCKENPQSVADFHVDENFVQLIEETIKKRQRPRSDKGPWTNGTAPRSNDYSMLTNHNESIEFPKDIHQEYLYDVPYEDLQGLTLDSVIEWKLGGAIVFNREMLHASSSCHSRKKFINIFAHSL